MTILIIICGLLFIGNLIQLGRMGKVNKDKKFIDEQEKKLIDKLIKYEQDKSSYDEKKSKFTKELKDLYNEKLEKLKNVVEGNIRKGYYSDNCINIDINGKEKSRPTYDYFVTEVDRYTNGMSKIKLDKLVIIRINDDVSKKSVINYATNNFKELMKTNDIEWLEPVDELQKERQKKLKRILDEN